MKLGILATGGREWIAGVVYTENLIRALALLSPPSEATLLVGPRRRPGDYSDIDPSPPVREFAWRDAAPPVRRLAAGIASALRGRSLRSLENSVRDLDCVFPATYSLGRRFPVPWLGWVPDLQPHERPEFFPEAVRRSRIADLEQLVMDADHTLVSSHVARRHLSLHAGIADERVSVVPFASVPSDAWYEPDPADVGRRRRLPERFLALPFQFWAHKNHRVAFAALALLHRRGIGDVEVVCTGRTHDPRDPGHYARLMRDSDREGVRNRIHVLGLLDRREQVQILRRAVAIVQPSYFEGWSALVEDARLLGKRLYVSDIPVHREQGPADAAFFPPDDASTLADLIAEDWPRLVPGPDRARERARRLEQVDAARRFARLFLDAVDRAREASTRRLGTCA